MPRRHPHPNQRVFPVEEPGPGSDRPMDHELAGLRVVQKGSVRAEALAFLIAVQSANTLTTCRLEGRGPLHPAQAANAALFGLIAKVLLSNLQSVQLSTGIMPDRWDPSTEVLHPTVDNLVAAAYQGTILPCDLDVDSSDHFMGFADHMLLDYLHVCSVCGPVLVVSAEHKCPSGGSTDPDAWCEGRLTAEGHPLLQSTLHEVGASARAQVTDRLRQNSGGQQHADSAAALTRYGRPLTTQLQSDKHEGFITLGYPGVMFQELPPPLYLPKPAAWGQGSATPSSSSQPPPPPPSSSSQGAVAPSSSSQPPPPPRQQPPPPPPRQQQLQQAPLTPPRQQQPPSALELSPQQPPSASGLPPPPQQQTSQQQQPVPQPPQQGPAQQHAFKGPEQLQEFFRKASLSQSASTAAQQGGGQPLAPLPFSLFPPLPPPLPLIPLGIQQQLQQQQQQQQQYEQQLHQLQQQLQQQQQQHEQQLQQLHHQHQQQQEGRQQQQQQFQQFLQAALASLQLPPC